MIEEDLGKLSLFAPAQGLRERVMKAVGRARKDRMVGRWFLGSALASVLLAGLTTRMVDADPTVEAPIPGELEAKLLAELHFIPDEMPIRWHLLVPPPPSLEEMPRWVQ